MFLSILYSSPAVALAWAIAIFLSLTVHEFAHAATAKVRGDSTAEREGRLTLNPAAHVDPLGLIALFLLGFGWAKPVPYNPYNLKNPKWDSVLISLAGPASNLLLALISAVVMRSIIASGGEISLLVVFLFFMVILNLFLMFFNIIPVPPLDGSRLLVTLLDHPRHARIREAILRYGPNALFIAVLISLFLPGVNVFGFITVPAFATCDAMVQGSCNTLFTLIFASI